ncbi:MAG TPA: hypothetical protein VJM50_19950, partial [Pyrinomonadaceae bacterium]|nr:hypothetical protein [Pyrinomonadaceae bacterium]
FVGTASTWLPLVEIIETVDLIGWYNCIAPTCSIVPIGPTEAPHFLIPRSDTPDPVEEKASVPMLNALIKLSNHTYQFIRNFGRVQ